MRSGLAPKTAADIAAAAMPVPVATCAAANSENGPRPLNSPIFKYLWRWSLLRKISSNWSPFIASPMALKASSHVFMAVPLPFVVDKQTIGGGHGLYKQTAIIGG